MRIQTAGSSPCQNGAGVRGGGGYVPVLNKIDKSKTEHKRKILFRFVTALVCCCDDAEGDDEEVLDVKV